MVMRCSLPAIGLQVEDYGVERRPRRRSCQRGNKRECGSEDTLSETVFRKLASPSELLNVDTGR